MYDVPRVIFLIVADAFLVAMLILVLGGCGTSRRVTAMATSSEHRLGAACGRTGARRIGIALVGGTLDADRDCAHRAARARIVVISILASEFLWTRRRSLEFRVCSAATTHRPRNPQDDDR